ncbi:MAG: PP2C family protein-serine/threonine phosphatase [Acidobacteriota bacterium]
MKPCSTPRRRAVFLILGLILSVLLGAHRDAGRLFQLSLDGDGLEEKVSAAVRQHMFLDTSNWEARSRTLYNPAAARYLEMGMLAGEVPGEGRELGLPPSLRPMALLWELELHESLGVDTVEARVTGDGDLRSLNLRPRPATQRTSEEDQNLAAAAALKRLVGERAEDFQVTLDQRLDNGGREIEYRWPPLADAAAELAPGAVARAEVQLRGRRLTDLEIEADLPMDEGINPDVLAPILQLMLVLAVLVYLAQSRRYLHPHRPVLVFGIIAAAFLALRQPATFDARLLEASSPLMALVQVLFSDVLFQSIAAALFFAGGYAAARDASPSGCLGLEALLRGRWLSPSVGVQAAAGLAWGAWIPAVVYLLFLLPPLRDSAVLAPGMPDGSELPAAALPGLAALLPPVGLAAVAFSTFVEPLFLAVLWRRGLARVFAIAVGTPIFAATGTLATGPVAGPWFAHMAWGFAAAVLLDQAYHRAGPLGALAASAGASVTAGALLLLLQPGPLRYAGAVAALGLVLAWAGFEVVRYVARDDPFQASDLPLPRRLRAERERIKAQLGVARQAQRLMIPESEPEVSGVELAAYFESAREVGGDFYDFIPLSGLPHADCKEGHDHRWALVVGDVSGKGLVASLYMTFTRGLLLAAVESCVQPIEVLREVNHHLRDTVDRTTFVTAFYAIFDPQSGRLDYARAGHNPAYLRRRAEGVTLPLQPKGFPLGAVGDALFSRSLIQEHLDLRVGDVLVLYSDGLTEAMDEHREEYGDHRLLSAIARTDGLPAHRIRDALLADIHAFVGAAPQHDDMSLVVMRYTGGVEIETARGSVKSST